jgi:uncharacterized protein (TIGR01777 family)
MRVLITGGTGFIGRALVPLLHSRGHSVVVVTRSNALAHSRLGGEIETVAAGSTEVLIAALERCDAVVNLAGEPIAGARWTAKRRRALWDSRVGLTRRLVDVLAATRRRPRVLVSGSAVGYYGDRGEEPLGEGARPGSDYLARLCQAWEVEALRASDLGMRVVTLRTGVVLGRDGGALGKMLLPFRWGVGGPLGSGRQYLPWIHLHDLARIIAEALVDERFHGPVNGVAPTPVTNREFAKALGKAVNRPAVCPVPTAVLRAVLGESSIVLIGSQRADAARLRQLAFPFEFATLDAALADIIGGSPVVVGPVSATNPADSVDTVTGRQYLASRRPRYELKTTTTVAAPIEETFAFFSCAENLGLLTPAAMRFSLVGGAPAIAEDAAMEYRMRVGPVPIRWRSRIVGWRADGFVDFQEKGPYRSWWHEHSFRSAGTSTVMEDRVCYTPPFGPLGRLVNWLFIAPKLRSIFQYRADVIRLRFGAP